MFFEEKLVRLICEIRGQEKNRIAKQFLFIEQLLRFRTAKSIALANASIYLQLQHFLK